MNRRDLLDHVEELAGLETREEAERATLATLRTPGEHVSAGEATVHVRAAVAALAEGGLERELQGAREQLPNGFATPFERGGEVTDGA